MNSLGKSVPFFRWSFLRMLLGMKTLTKNWQIYRISNFSFSRAGCTKAA